MYRLGSGLVLAVTLLGMTACGNQASTKEATSSTSSQQQVKSSAKVSETSSSVQAVSSEATPTRQPNIAEKIALVLLTPGADSYSQTGKQLLATGEAETAYPNSTGMVDGAPAGAQVYTLSIQYESKTPFIVISGNQGYLFATQSPVPYTYLRQHALNVDLDKAWNADFNSADLTNLATQISVSDHAMGEAQASPSDTEAYQDLANYTYVYTEDDSTVSGSGPMTSQFVLQTDGETYRWLSKDANGDVKYDFVITDVQFDPNDPTKRILTASDTDTDRTYRMYMSAPHDRSSYDIRCAEINYYGMFDYSQE